MKASIKFNEITGWIENKYKQKPEIVGVDEKNLEVRYKPAFFIPQMSIKLHIESIDKDCIRLSYDGSVGLPQIISAVVEIVKKNIPAGVEINTGNKTVTIHPQQIEKLEKALKFVTLSDVVFDNEGIKTFLTLS